MNTHRLATQLCLLGIALFGASSALAQPAPPPPSDVSSVDCASLESACQAECGSADPACFAGCAALCSTGPVDCALSYDAAYGACIVSTFAAASYASGTIVDDTGYCGCYALCGQTPTPCAAGPVTGLDDFTTLSCEDGRAICYNKCADRDCYEACDRRCEGTEHMDHCSTNLVGGACFVTICGGVSGDDYDCETYENANPSGGPSSYCGCHSICGQKPAPCA